MMFFLLKGEKMHKYKKYYFIVFLVFITALAFALYNKKNVDKSQYVLGIASYDKRVAGDIVNTIDKKLNIKIGIDNEGLKKEPELRITHAYKLTKEDLQNYDSVKIAEDKLIFITNGENALKDLKEKEIADYLTSSKGISDASMFLGSKDAIDYLKSRYNFNSIDKVFSVHDNDITGYVRRDFGTLGAVFLSEYIPSEKQTLLKVDGKTFQDAGYSFKDDLILLIKKDVKEKDKIIKVIEELKYEFANPEITDRVKGV